MIENKVHNKITQFSINYRQCFTFPIIAIANTLAARNALRSSILNLKKKIIPECHESNTQTINFITAMYCEFRLLIVLFGCLRFDICHISICVATSSCATVLTIYRQKYSHSYHMALHCCRFSHCIHTSFVIWREDKRQQQHVTVIAGKCGRLRHVGMYLSLNVLKSQQNRD